MFLFSLVTPEKKIVTDVEVEEVLVPAFNGQLDIFPGHAPLITTLSVGLLKYRLKGSTELITTVVSWGYCEVTPLGVNVMAETSESLEDIDRDRAEDALKKSQKMLTEPNLEPDQIKKYQRKMQRAFARIELTKRTDH